MSDNELETSIKIKRAIIGQCSPFGQKAQDVYNRNELETPEEFVLALWLGGILNPVTPTDYRDDDSCRAGRDDFASKFGFGFGSEFKFMSEYEFDAAVIGVYLQSHTHDGKPALPVVAYSYEKVIEILMKDGASYIEASEYHDFNQASAWVGPLTPVFIYKPLKKFGKSI